jgi:hypothetical protein
VNREDHGIFLRLRTLQLAPLAGVRGIAGLRIGGPPQRGARRAAFWYRAL